MLFQDLAWGGELFGSINHGAEASESGQDEEEERVIVVLTVIPKQSRSLWCRAVLWMCLHGSLLSRGASASSLNSEGIFLLTLAEDQSCWRGRERAAVGS